MVQLVACAIEIAVPLMASGKMDSALLGHVDVRNATKQVGAVLAPGISGWPVEW
jgi:hypothetical protein